MTLIPDLSRPTDADDSCVAATRLDGAAAAGAGAGLAEAVVDLGAIAHNTALLKAVTHGGLMAVVKANAFGHGAVPVDRTALATGASWLGVTSVPEAMELRTAGISAPVLAWMHLPYDDLRPVVCEGIDLAVSSR